MYRYFRFLFVYFAIAFSGYSQINFTDYKLSPREYNLGGISIEGAVFIDHEVIIQKSGLQRGEKIAVPSDKISKAISNLWDQGLFSEVAILKEKTQGNTIFLKIKLKERPRMSRYTFSGISKSDADQIRDDLDLFSGKTITEALKMKVKNISRNHFIEKGYLKAKSSITTQNDTLLNNSKILKIEVDKGEKFKINEIVIQGNSSLSADKIKRLMKETKERKWFRFYKKSKFQYSLFDQDKSSIIEKYNEIAHRDARILMDSIYDFDESSINVFLKIEEGNQYFIREINWSGNEKYSSGLLDTVLGIKKGDLYNQTSLETKLFMNPNGTDISSIYMDDGYLFFQVTPIEKKIENDSVDLEIKIYEGKQARIKKVNVTGNTKTSDHVILRDLYTHPGDLFSRDAIIRTQRQLAQNGYFDPEKLGVNPMPNPTDGTVDIEYVVEERPNDQIELSGGWGNNSLVGTLGLTFNNFSARKLFKKGSWSPLPSGDGQRLSIRAQSSGYFFQSYNMSFTEPWLGGKKPNSFTISAYHSMQSYDRKFITDSLDAEGNKAENPFRRFIKITGVSVGLGKRLKWPDDYFSVYYEAGYQHYKLNNFGNVFSFSDGFVNNPYLLWKISRNSIDQPLYPRSGSSISLSLKSSVYPYSRIQNYKDHSLLTDQEKYKFLQYNKFKFTSSWFTPISKNKKLVVNARLGFGLLNGWNKNLGAPPFERFYLGGSGLSGFSLDGREIIALRGYDEQTISSNTGDRLISKYTLELRYPVSLNPSATIYLLSFLEGGNSWNDYKKYNPFKVKRSAGVGVRIFLPMFGLLGLDYGFGFDPLDPGAQGEVNHNAQIQSNGYRGQFHFTIGMNIGEL
ncbi:MAG: outer membrane protein assembly factor BamA [Flavobacteriales bacterium]|jgi:outer membrane protein insertion porin family|nr:outer membrane protein assembly factor BamA [Flavobacteriales bacterium]MDG1440141.1 outer membrane protein assembly factor BamA [Flavobacteriales bacterium]MDG1797236.1 outer membrane protein assembly factor BamA [Flavobacteriales bacterium]